MSDLSSIIAGNNDALLAVQIETGKLETEWNSDPVDARLKGQDWVYRGEAAMPNDLLD